MVYDNARYRIQPEKRGPSVRCFPSQKKMSDVKEDLLGGICYDVSLLKQAMIFELRMPSLFSP